MALKISWKYTEPFYLAFSYYKLLVKFNSTALVKMRDELW